MKNEKVTNPLYISSFNRHMCWTTLYVLILIYVIKTMPNLPQWVKVILQVTCWIDIAGGIIVCLGYLVAVMEKNVTILVIKDKNKKE